MSDVLAGLDRVVGVICRFGVILAMLGLFFLLLLGVAGRSLPFLAVPGYDEIVELLVVWLTMLGAVALWRDGALYRVSSLEASLPPVVRRVLALAQQVIMFGFALVLVWFGTVFLLDAAETAPFLGVDRAWWYAALPVAGVPMTLYSVAGIWRVLRGERRTLAESGSLVA